MELKKSNRPCFISRVRANDEPHGVFSLEPEQQSIVVVGSGSQVNRALVINVTRLAGLFGNASVGYRIGSRAEQVLDIKEIIGAHAVGRLIFSEGQASSAVTVLISREVERHRSHGGRWSFASPRRHTDFLLFPRRCFCQ